LAQAATAQWASATQAAIGWYTIVRRRYATQQPLTGDDDVGARALKLVRVKYLRPLWRTIKQQRVRNTECNSEQLISLLGRSRKRSRNVSERYQGVLVTRCI
jgi:hypothetical protein